MLFFIYRYTNIRSFRYNEYGIVQQNSPHCGEFSELIGCNKVNLYVESPSKVRFDRKFELFYEYPFECR